MFDKLNFFTPADEFQTGAPLGNGRIGSMQWGIPGNEIFSFNHDSLYRRKYQKEIKSAHLLEPIRDLIRDGNYKGADELFVDFILDLPQRCNSYQPFFDLQFLFADHSPYTDYQRTLDMEKGILSFSYKKNDSLISWESFISEPHQVSAIRITADTPLSCELLAFRQEDPECSFVASCAPPFLCTCGKFIEGTTFLSCNRILTDGDLTFKDAKALCENFTWLEVYTALSIDSTDFSPLKDQLSALPSYEEIRKKHISDFQALYQRVSFLLDTQETSAENAFQISMKQEVPLEMYGYLLNFGRYCIISSSRVHTNPINLQGIWNHDILPAWDSGYTTDINIEMAYWPAQILHLTECETPLFDWVLSHWDTMQTYAEQIFGIKDAVYINQFTDLYMTPTCDGDCAPIQVLWSGACPWIGQHFYKYWRYTNDDEFMRTKGFPYLKACANFYLGFLTKNKDGRYEAIPSVNPENTNTQGAWLTNTATMDLCLIHELMQNLLYINDALKLNDPDVEKWLDIDHTLKDYYLLEDGTLHEFTENVTEQDTGHRHLSHLYGLFPADLWKTDDILKEASIKGIDRRLSKGFSAISSWCVSWHSNCFAAIGDGDHALEFVDHLIKSSIMENFLPSHNDWRDGSQYALGPKTFQIDSLMGISRAIANMFLRSDDQGTYILPALPARLKKGSICGVCGYDSFVYDIYWDNNRLQKLVVYAQKGGSVRLHIPEEQIHCNHAYTKTGTSYLFENLGVGDQIEIFVK